MGDIIRIVKSLEDSVLLIDGASETVKYKIKKQEGRLFGAMMTPMACSLIAVMTPSLRQPVAFSLTSAMSGKRVMTPRKGQKGEFLPLLASPLPMKILEKGDTRAGKGYSNMDHIDRNF